MMLAGAVGHDPERAAARALAVTMATADNDTLDYRPLLLDGGIALYVVERSGDAPHVQHAQGSAGQEGWLVGDPNYLAGREGQGALDKKPCVDGAPGRWTWVERGASRGTVRIRTDRLGLAWVYVARTTDACVFSNHFGAVAAQLEGGLSVDEDVVLMELALGYTPDDRTVFKEINLLPAHATVEISPNGARLVDRDVPQYGDRDAGASDDEKFDQLEGIFTRITRQVVKPVHPGLVVSMSGGFDSRYSLAFLAEQCDIPDLFTFGDPDCAEVARAREVCEIARGSTTLFSPGEGSWEQWRRSIHALGNAGMTQWSGWAESWLRLLSASGRYSMIGFLGDAISGKHLGERPPPDGNWLEGWVRWSMAGIRADSDELRGDARAQLQECVRAGLESTTNGASFAFPHQLALHLDLYGRQRRWVASQPNLIARFLTPVLFFYDEELIDFWANLPEHDLLGQRLYLGFARQRFPRLFPAGEGESPRLLQRVLNKGRRLLRQDHGTDRSGYQVPVIDHRQIIVPNSERIRELAARVRPLVDSLIDMDVFLACLERCEHASGGDTSYVLRAVNLFLLLDLANRTGSDRP
jgi:hypothetical protein